MPDTVFDTNQGFAHLTDRVVSGARCADTVDRVVLRCKRRGLELHLYRSGKAPRWYARPTIGGVQQRLNLGSTLEFPTVADAAAKLALEVQRLTHGTPNTPTPSQTFGQLLDDFLDDYATRKRARTQENYRHALRLVSAKLRDKRLRQVTRLDLVGCIEGAYADLVERGVKGAQANTLRAALQSAWRWGLTKGRVDVDLVARLPVPADTTPRAVTLTDAQVKAFFIAMDDPAAPASNVMRLAMKIAALTAQRIGAVLLTRAEDVDLVGAVWVIHPGDGTKVRARHAVPLPPLALAAWREALALTRARDDDFVFPADATRRSVGGPMRQDSAANAMARVRAARPALAGVTLHDLRRTARTRVAGVVDREAAERWLGHTVGSPLERTYDRSDHLEAKRRAAEAWETVVDILTT